ncbi:beta-glucosidase [Klenkia taihuensis]|uniref:Beta-glucosidase n=1 Tax=Klenkia taihuensis TaxID=1225127 RepID=A0A1I1U3X5_9ACTN|nr:glycoside hydrolase family 3 N-terminal domain-containing protein [Klenkia taihuensis]GHE06950.1 glycosyl hydrolase [Klenkia taihuensis]SFD65395.1 beta-glucosidase [Klenkia taihuensis]
MQQDHRLTGSWHDTDRPAHERAAALLAEMTLEEKLGQIGSSWPGEEDAGGDVAPMQETFRGARPFDEEIVDGLGHITRAFGTAPVEPGTGKERLTDLQRQVVAANRFGIPAIAHEECLTGLTAWKATVYPTSLAWGASWDPDLVQEMGRAIGEDMASLGVHQGLAPVLDVVRDYRWGRVEETMGEDPYLVSEVGLGYVTGLQSGGVLATLKHFAGYSASRGGRNHAPVGMGPREFADVVLPPFEKAVVVGRVASVMNSYADVDGVAPAADHALLTELLRDRWGFTGTVVSDYWAVAFLATTHRVAEDLSAAGAMSLAAGMDVELPHTLAFGERLAQQVRAGLVPEEDVDRAALRVLTQKAHLGLLDPDWNPGGPESPVDLDSSRNRTLARRLARRSITLLSDDGTSLPLEGRRIAVVGPGADDAQCLFGCYSFPNHVVPKHPGVALGVEAPTVVEALRAALPDSTISHLRGCDITGGDTSGIAAAAALAADSDVTVLVVGDRAGMFGHGTSGEGCDVVTLDLPGVQEQLAEAVLEAAAEAGRRVVLVVLSGRPYAVGRHAARAAATLQVFFPGVEGATALAEVLTGVAEPAGRLPVQIPGDNAPHPSTYLAPPLALKSDGVSNIDPTPAFPFGHGLSWTTFEFGAARVDAAAVPVSGTVTVQVEITNTGGRAGSAVPQLYLSDPVASTTRPVRRLIGFTRVELQAGQRSTVSFEVPADLAAFTGADLRRRVEPGRIELTVAQSAADPGVAVAVELTGAVRIVDHTRALSTRATTTP